MYVPCLLEQVSKKMWHSGQCVTRCSPTSVECVPLCRVVAPGIGGRHGSLRVKEAGEMTRHVNTKATG